MRSRSFVKRHRKKIMVPLASIGDLAFLLIMFFMLTSTFIKEAPLDLTPPESLDIERIEESQISVSIDEDGNIYLQGVQMADAEAVEWGLTGLLEKIADESERLVLFRCDRDAPKTVFEPVIGAIAQAGGRIIAVGELDESLQP